MLLTISNVDASDLSIVVEPFADERSLPPNCQLSLAISLSTSNDFELVMGDRILSVYIPDGAEYAFQETQNLR